MKTLLLVGLLLAGDLRLIDAVKNNDAAAVRSLIAQRVDVNATEVDGSTALHWAAQRDNLRNREPPPRRRRERRGPPTATT